MVSVAWQESGIIDELAHIPSGYSYVRYLDFRLNPEHPPVVKALSGIPLLFADLSFPTDHSSWTDDVNGQWTVGNQFIYQENGTRAEQIVFLARLFPILLTLILIFFVWWWARELMGSWWALLPAAFAALSPNILAHGHYVTTDMGAALGFFVGLYFFVRYLISPTPSRMIWAGIFFGVAELMKFSNVLLIPIFVILVLTYWWVKAREKGVKFLSVPSWKILWKYIRGLILIGVIGYLLVWAVYALFTINYPIERQNADTIYILESFSGGPDQGLAECLPQNLSMRCLAELDIWFSSNPVFRSIGHYLLGVLMVIQRSAGGNTAYFLGDLGNVGWWYYFPVVFLLKAPLPTLLFIFGGLCLGIRRWNRNRKQRNTKRIYEYLSLSFPEFSMWVLIVVYWLYSIQSPLNIGFRHVLPTLPFMFILAGGAFKRWVSERGTPSRSLLIQMFSAFSRRAMVYAKGMVVAILFIWLVAETAFSYPFYLSYFNEIGGGVWKGYTYVTDSNYDWGQDMKRLRTWVEEHDVEKIAVDYFGAADVGYYLGEKGVVWNSNKGNPIDEGIEWIAISINAIQSTKAELMEGFAFGDPDAYDFISHYDTPYARAGTSIFIYRLDGVY